MPSYKLEPLPEMIYKKDLHIKITWYLTNHLNPPRNHVTHLLKRDPKQDHRAI